MLTDVQITGHHGEASIEIGYRKNRQIFMPLLEEELVWYILRTSEIYQGISPKDDPTKKKQVELKICEIIGNVSV